MCLEEGSPFGQVVAFEAHIWKQVFVTACLIADLLEIRLNERVQCRRVCQDINQNHRRVNSARLY